MDKAIRVRVWLVRLAWVIGGVLLLGLLAWVSVPPLLKWQAQSRLSETLGRSVTIGDVDFKPWSLELTATDLAIAGAQPSDEPLLQVPRLYANVAISSLWHLAPVLQALEVDAPRLRVARTAPGHYDIDDLLSKFGQPEPETADHEPARFALYNMQLRDGAVRFDDRPAGRVHEVEALRLTLPFVSNLPADVDVQIEPRLAFRLNGSSFDSGAQATPFAQTREGTLHLRVAELDLAPYLGYVPDTVPVRIVRGRLSAELTLDFAQSSGQAPAIAVRGSVGMGDVAVASRSGDPLLAWRQATLALREVQPLQRRLGFESLRIEGLRAHAGRDREGRINWARLAATTPTEPPPASSPTPAWQLSLDTFELADAGVSWRDASVSPAAELRLDAVSLTAGALRWPVQKPAPLRLAATLRGAGASADALGRLAVDGTVSDRAATLALELSALSLRALSPYLAASLAPALEGQASARGRLQWSGDDRAPRLQLALQEASLDGLRLREGESDAAGEANASLKRLGLADVDVDLLERRLRLGRVTLSEPALRLARDGQGRLNVAQWWVGGNEGTAPDGGADARGPWRLQLDELSVEAGTIDFSDAKAVRADRQPTRVALQDVRLGLRQLQWPASGAPAALTLAARVSVPGMRGAGGSSLDWRGEIGLAPLSAEGSLRVRRFPLPLLEPYVPDPLQVRLVRAAAGYDGQLALREQPAGWAVDLAGDVRLTNVQINSLPGGGAAAGSATEDELLSWRSLGLHGMRFALQPKTAPRLDIGRAVLEDFYTRLVVTEQGRFNLQQIATPANAPPDDGTAARPGSDAPMRIGIGETRLANGRIDFTDRFIQPNYSAALTELQGALGAFRSDSDELATLELRGRAAGSATLEVNGRLNPMADPLALDIKASMRGLELPPLSPYAAKYAGYAIERGRLSMNVAYRIDPNGQLEASNQLVLNQLTFGEKVDSPTATQLPVLLAVALLKDRNGVIDLNLPIKGSLNDPQFSIGGIIVRLIGSLLTKALTAPFALLAGGGGGDDEALRHIAFAPGTVQLAAGATDAIDRVAKALAERPALKLTIKPSLDADAERQARRQAALEARLLDEARASGSAGGAAATKDPLPALTPPERARLIGRLYRNADWPDKPRNALGLARRLPVEEMEALLLAHMPADDDAMRELARQRGEAVREALIAQGVPGDRVALAEPRLSNDGGEARPGVELDLSVK